MSLPKYVTPYETVEVEGEEIKIRALTRAEAARIQKLGQDAKGLAAVEIAILAGGTDTDPKEVTAWYETAPTYVIDPIIIAIKRISRLDDEEAQKSGGTSDSAG